MKIVHSALGYKVENATFCALGAFNGDAGGCFWVVFVAGGKGTYPLSPIMAVLAEFLQLR